MLRNPKFRHNGGLDCNWGFLDRRSRPIEDAARPNVSYQRLNADGIVNIYRGSLVNVVQASQMGWGQQCQNTE